DVDDLAPGLLDHDPAGELAELEDRGEVDLEHRIPVAELVVERLEDTTDSVARHEDVEAAEPLDGLAEPAPQIGAIAEVRAHGKAAELHRRPLGALRATEDGHGRASLPQRPGHRSSQPAAAPGHERAPAAQTEVVKGHSLEKVGRVMAGSFLRPP